MTEPFVDEGQVIREYGASVPNEYGGFFGEAGKFVALFTENLAHHEAALRELLPFPDHLVVRRADRTWLSVEQSKNEVTRILLADGGHPGVTAPGGIGVRDGQHVVVVGIDPYSDELAREVARTVSPHAVDIWRIGRAHPLSQSAPTSVHSDSN